VQLSPSKNQPDLPSTKVALDHFEAVDPNLRFAVGVPSVEMREAMVFETSWFPDCHQVDTAATQMGSSGCADSRGQSNF
jgi:hypothetical protein